MPPDIALRLEFDQSVYVRGALRGLLTEGALGAIPINKRTANTTLIVRDQQTVVIGGLVRDAITNGETKVPILGDIPVLVALFRKRTNQNEKRNLILVMTPYIIRSQQDLRTVFELEEEGITPLRALVIVSMMVCLSPP